MKRTVVFDIDGTICYQRNSEADYGSYRYDDCEPIPKAIDLLRTIYFAGFRIVFSTGREKKYRQVTMDWLKKHAPFLEYYSLYMRPDGVYTKNALIKKTHHEEYFRNDVVLWFDDNEDVLEYARSFGIPAFDLGKACGE